MKSVDYAALPLAAPINERGPISGRAASASRMVGISAIWAPHLSSREWHLSAIEWYLVARWMASASKREAPSARGRDVLARETAPISERGGTYQRMGGTCD